MDVIGIGLCGKLHQIALCGPLGEKGIAGFLRMKSNQCKICRIFFLRSLFEYFTSIGGVSCGSIFDILDHMSVCL